MSGDNSFHIGEIPGRVDKVMHKVEPDSPTNSTSNLLKITLPETVRTCQESGNPKWKQSSSNHPFSGGKLAVSFREGK